MTITAKPLFEALQAANAETTQYTAPSGTRTIIDKFTGTNTTAAVATLTVKLIASGGAASASNTIVSAKTLQPGETYTFPELVGHVLNPGGFISTLASAAAAITIRSSGREVS
jgi:phage tail tape-measure protein